MTDIGYNHQDKDFTNKFFKNQSALQNRTRYMKKITKYDFFKNN